jgi:hypothetical protein
MHQIFACCPGPSSRLILRSRLILAAIVQAMQLLPKQSTRAHDAYKEECACNASRVSITHTPSAACRGLRYRSGAWS